MRNAMLAVAAALFAVALLFTTGNRYVAHPGDPTQPEVVAGCAALGFAVAGAGLGRRRLV